MNLLTIPPGYKSAGRQFWLHLPNDRAPAVPVPLGIGLHGGGSSGDAFATQSQMNPVADQMRFIVAYPDGSKGPPGYKIWNAPPCFNTPADDVWFVTVDLPSYVNSLYKTVKTWLFGFSCGAILVWKCYRDAADKVSAFVAHSGDIGLNQYTPAPSVVRRFLYIQGKLDTVCPPQGGVGMDTQGGCNHASVAVGTAELAKWGSSSWGQVIQEAGYDYQDLHSGLARLVLVDKEGHQWTGGVADKIPYTPGGPGATQPFSNAFSASQMAAEWCLPNPR